ncbi:endopeptidase La [Candidatus Karelsulcia muelleri]|uniref:endopeptidase La n=1 Tax=Candidatus Karelsulcia muelleri TaxID=336810 RepID=UPI000B92F682|nr:endopeptidase La [Candidatus Karelsulcia muelleri]ASS46900.1 Lon protease 2 [Candidatus Karelsulcia muelleri]
MLLHNIENESEYDSKSKKNNYLYYESSDFKPLIEKYNRIKYSVTEYIYLLTVKNVVLFPDVVIPITAVKQKSINLFKSAYSTYKKIGILTKKYFNTTFNIAKFNIPTFNIYSFNIPRFISSFKIYSLNKTTFNNTNDIYYIGTVAKILKLLIMPDGNTTVILQGISRFQIIKLIQVYPYFKAEIIDLKDEKPQKKDKEYLILIDSIKEIAIKIIQDNYNLPSESSFAISNIESKSFLINFVAYNLNIEINNKQILLEYDFLKQRAIETFRFLNIEYEKIKLKNDIQYRVRYDIDQQQKEYFLNQQIKAIQEELGDFSYEKEVEVLRIKSYKKNWSKEAQNQFDRELSKFQRTNPQMPEYTILRNYLDLMLDLPWRKYSKDNYDLYRAQKILDKDHFGIDKVKERIIEYLSVLKLKGDLRSPILCFYGPPGIGKTSLGRSIASALNRKYVRISLGGLNDEAEIRGHRKTYIGAMPGRVLQSIKKAGTSNPVFVLDEIDKMGLGSQGNTSSAMLEVLDPEQNKEFYDNFLEMGYDLSKVIFIATANSLYTINIALLDRMEIIDMNGYTVEEKIEISKKHLIPKQLKENGLKSKDLILGVKQIEKIIESYTRESGVRSLEKKISKIVRYAAKNIAMNKKYLKRINMSKIEEVLGPPNDPEKYEFIQVPGVVTGLAWTIVGGEILYIESTLLKGRGNLSITGNVGEVMKESATIAFKYIKSHNYEFGIDEKMFELYNIHIHVPEGGVHKDGPSAGITMLTSIISSFLKKKIRPYLAMTGEITLRGKVLPVGGIKEKILAAKRANIKEIILSKANKKEIDDIKKVYLKGLKFHFVSKMNEVIDLSIIK